MRGLLSANDVRSGCFSVTEQAPINLFHKKVLIVRLSALGDVIRTIPSVVGLMKLFPETQFTWLVEDSSVGLLRAIPNLKVITIDRKALKSRRPLLVLRTIMDTVKRIKKENFDCSVDFHGVFKSGLYPFLSGIRDRLGFERGGSKEGSRWFLRYRFELYDTRISRYERNLALASGLHPAVEPEAPQFMIPAESRQKVLGLMGAHPILLFPGTSFRGRNKRWPVKSWAWLFEKLHQDYPVSFLLGPSEEKIGEELGLILGDRFRALPPLSLLELSLALQEAKLLVSCDSGPMHLASVLKTPVVALMGPSDPIVNGPLPFNSRLVLAGVPCGPCRNHACDVLICQDSMTPKVVWRTCSKFLQDLEST